MYAFSFTVVIAMPNYLVTGPFVHTHGPIVYHVSPTVVHSRSLACYVSQLVFPARFSAVLVIWLAIIHFVHMCSSSFVIARSFGVRGHICAHQQRLHFIRLLAMRSGA